VICDLVGFSEYAPLFKRLGKPLLGCSEIADVLELDRRRGLEVMKLAGISIPTTHYFDSPKSAETLTWSHAPGYVVKPSDNLSVGKTYLCEQEGMYQWALSTLPPNQALVVQEIVSGVEVSTEGWFNGRDWVPPFNHTFEEKKLAAGGVGPMTGCMGNVVFPLREPNKLVRETVMKLEPMLRKVGYKGPLDINCIVGEKSANALEITARFGYDALEALMHGTKGPFGSFLFDVATGVAKSIPVLGYDYLIAVRVVCPEYPYGRADQKARGMPVFGLEGPGGSVFPCDVYKEKEKYYYAASDGVLAKVAANGRDVREARRRVYKRVDDVRASGVFYRNDIGARVERDMNQLKAWGWL
jgi:phosphoribosylamine--glycine ligase